MADFSTYLRNALRDHVFRTGSFTKPSEIWISLHTGNPGRTGANEVSPTDTGYVRIQLDPLDANWSTAGGDGTVTNADPIEFASPSGGTNWGSITWSGLWDAVTGGNFLADAQLTQAKSVNQGDPGPIFPAGELDYTFD